MAARVERPHRHTIARGEPCNAIAQRSNRAGHLVSHDLRKVHAAVHLAMEDVQIGSADAAMRDTDLYLSFCWQRRNAVANADRFVSFVIGSFHF